MKRLMMVAAAMTIAGGAYAQCGLPDPVPGQPTAPAALVYNVKINAKTTVAKYLKGRIISGSGGVCGYQPGDTEVEYVIYRDPGNVKLQGYWLNCSRDCTEDQNTGLSSFDTAWLWLWEKKSKSYWFNDGLYGYDDAPAITKYWDASDVNGPLVDLATIEPRAIIQWGPNANIAPWDIGPSFIAPKGLYNTEIRNPFNLIGKKNDRVEAFWSIGQTFVLPQYIGSINTVPPRAIAIYAAGFGKFDTKNGVMRNITGNFAGLIDAPYYVSKNICAPAVAFDCCSCDDEYNQSVFYGNWSMKFNSSLSKLAVTDAARIYTSKCPQNYDNEGFRSNDYRWLYDLTP